MQCVTSLPVASTAGGNRTARRNLEYRQEKTRSASRAAGLSVSCWDWLEAVHSNVARVARCLDTNVRTGTRAFQKPGVLRGIRAEALSLSHLTVFTTRTINIHAFWINLLSQCEGKITRWTTTVKL